jgi:hypothetical protein
MAKKRSPDPAAVLTEVLEWLEDQLDLEHIAAVEDRHRRALNWEPVDRPPVTIAAPASSRFPFYPYSQAFRDPAKLLINELVDASAGLGPMPSVVNSVLLKDDFPLQIRANYGNGLIASLFGAEVRQVEDNFPWTAPVGPQHVKAWLARGVPELETGLYPQIADTMAYYRTTLAPYPRCSAAIHITQPDLQGPFDIATQLWGGEIFTAFYDCPDLLQDFMELVAETYIMVCRAISPLTTQSLGDGFICLHWSVCKGGCLLKDDSSTMLSPRTYKEFIQPVNEKVLTSLGGGGIHWCGSGDQWRQEFVETQGLETADISQPDLIDLVCWAQSLSQHRVAVSRTAFSSDGFYGLRAVETFPTGAAFMVTVDSLDEGRRILEGLEEGP